MPPKKKKADGKKKGGKKGGKKKGGKKGGKKDKSDVPVCMRVL